MEPSNAAIERLRRNTNLSYFEMTIRTFDRQALLRTKEMVDAESMVLRDRLRKATNDERRTGRPTDPEWLHRTQFALEAKACQSQIIQHRLSVLKEQQRQASNRTFERRFIEAACKGLPPDVYRKLVDYAWMGESGAILPHFRHAAVSTRHIPPSDLELLDRVLGNEIDGVIYDEGAWIDLTETAGDFLELRKDLEKAGFSESFRKLADMAFHQGCRILVLDALEDRVEGMIEYKEWDSEKARAKTSNQCTCQPAD